MDESMDLLILGGDVGRVTKIEETVQDIMEEEEFPLASIDTMTVYAAETKHGNRKEERIYFLPHSKSVSHIERLRGLTKKVADELGLSADQVVCVPQYRS